MLRDKLSGFHAPGYCLIKIVTPLFKGQTTRPLLVKEDKPTPQPTRANGSEHQYLKYSSALEQWIYPSGIDMKRFVGAGSQNGTKNGSDGRNLVLVFDQT